MSAPADPRAFLRSLFDAAVAAALPDLCIPPNLPPPPRGRTWTDDYSNIAQVLDFGWGARSF